MLLLLLPGMAWLCRGGKGWLPTCHCCWLTAVGRGLSRLWLLLLLVLQHAVLLLTGQQLRQITIVLQALQVCRGSRERHAGEGVCSHCMIQMSLCCSVATVSLLHSACAVANPAGHRGTKGGAATASLLVPARQHGMEGWGHSHFK
jgi:hypothetical protein